ncbi:MAG: polymerase sigma factor SigX [Verrucomicrobiota bacterium]|jgi:RNA polymerase sigma-70 factor (ECF subfamily)
MTEAEIVNFFMAHRDRLWAMANLILRDHHLTEDALQETLLTLLQKRESYDPTRPLLHWAFGITRNKALKIVDKSHRYCLFGEEQLHILQNVLISDAQEGASPDRRLDALQHCLSLMSPENRQLMLQKYQQRASIRKISGSSGRSEVAVSSLLQRLRAQLHRCIRNQPGMAT